MMILVVLRFALQALRGHRLRSALTALGIVIGVGSVVLMVAVGAGTQSRIKEEIERLGTNMILVTSAFATTGGVRSGTRPTLTDADAAAIRSEADGIVTAAPSLAGSAQLVAGSANWSTGVLGVTEDYFMARDWRLASGRSIVDADVEGSSKVVMLGQTVATKLFEDLDPIGETVRVDHIPMEVIGLLAIKGETMDGSDLDNVVMIPLTTTRDQLLGRSAAKAGSVSVITVKASDAGTIDQAIEEVRDILRIRHRLGVEQADDFRINNVAETMRLQEESSAAMTQLFAAVASISLLVGGIGIMNIMLVSVTERTREIGIRMAVGAKSVHIMAQFLSEATFLSIAGGIAGAVIGLGGAIVMERQFGMRVEITADTVVLAFIFSALVGLIFGLYPAIRASQKSPMEALRYE